METFVVTMEKFGGNPGILKETNNEENEAAKYPDIP